jgi:fructokinase
MRVVGIEAGGTKIVCATGTGPDDCSELHRIPTTTPDETIEAMVAYVAARSQEAPVDAIGVATFGPIDLDPSSPTHGHLTTTPKAAWQGVDLVGRLATATGLPVGFDTDVNGAAVGEHRWGAGIGADNLVYLTVGTGVGGGVVVDGRPVHGLLHPEVGHLVVRHHPDDDFAGSCRFHGDCLEGLAAGPSLVGRFGRHGEELSGDELTRAVAFTSYAVAQAVVAVTYVVSPRRVVVGGGVSKLDGFMPAVRATTSELLAGALASPVLTGDLADYVVAPALGDRSGVLGALALGVRAAGGPEGRDDAG